MDRKNSGRIQKAKLTVKNRIKQAGYLVKDHWVPLVLGVLAIGGGAYAYTRLRGRDGEEPTECQPGYDYEPVNDIRETIQDAWDACDHEEPDPYTGPTED